MSISPLKSTSDPYNCFTLDFNKNKEIEGKGVKSISLNFPKMAGTSVHVLLQGQNLACHRTVQLHKFYSSGADVHLSDLGEPSWEFNKRAGVNLTTLRQTKVAPADSSWL